MIVIYILIFPNGKQYVGQTTNYLERIRCHLKGNQLVDRAIKKYGWENVQKIEMECSEDGWMHKGLRTFFGVLLIIGGLFAFAFLCGLILALSQGL